MDGNGTGFFWETRKLIEVQFRSVCICVSSYMSNYDCYLLITFRDAVNDDSMEFPIS